MKKLILSLFIVIVSIGANAQISVTTSSGCFPYNSIASAVTVSGAFSYDWYLDYNLIGSGQTLNFTVSSPGSHFLQLRVYDNLSNQIFSDYLYLYADGYSGINSAISASGACPNDPISFQLNGYTSDYPSVTWDYGDGSPLSSGYNYSANHTYTGLGSYTVSATVSSSCGVQTLTLPISITNNSAVGNIYVQAQSDSVCPGNVSIYTPYGYENFIVDFGDGAVEYAKREHTYNVPGMYVIKATFFNGCGNSASTTDTLYVVNNIAIGNEVNTFSINDSLVCPATVVNFYPPGSYVSYLWNFGNGNSSTVSNPTTTYASTGTYSVSLTIRNGCGYTKTINRNVYVQNNIPVAPFTLNVVDSVCPNTSLIISLPQNGNGNRPTYYLNFGDGTTGVAQNQNEVTHPYSIPGTYTLTATIVNGCGQSASSSNTVVVNPLATLSAGSFFAGSPLDQSCPGDTVFFIVNPADIGTALFTYGDGATATVPTDTLIGPDGIVYAVFKHVYNALGTYNPTVKITSPCGSSLTQPAGVINISENNGIDDNAGFFFNESKYYCLNEPVAFLAYGANSYEWDFGDGSGTLITNYSLGPVNHAYSQPGEYTVKVVLRNSCGASDTISNPVTIPDSHINISTSSVTAQCHQQNGKAISIVSGANPPFIYDWTNADHSFIADSLYSGIYYVTVTDAKGCKNFAVATVNDQQAPTISLNNAIPANCFGEASGAIDITLIGSSAPYTYVWTNGKTTEDINQLVAGPYEVVVTDANGCRSAKSITVTQPDDFTISYVSVPSLCGFNTGTIQTTVQGSTGPYNYLWSNGYTGASLSGLATGIYSVTVVDSKGCLKEKVTSVNEQTSPISVLDSISTINCSLGTGGADVNISTYLGSSSSYTYSWNNGAVTQDLVNATPGFYSLITTGSNGCRSILTLTINEDVPDGLPICAVTVDSITQTNRLIWEMYSRTDIESFNVYRESSQAGLYYLVGNVDADSLHEFIDPSADPATRGWRYKLSTVSFCGEESEQSDLHKTIHLTLNQGLGNSINLIWDNYEGLSFNEFYIWRYTTPTGWMKIDSLPSNLFSYTDLTAPSQAVSPDLYYYIEGGPITLCDPTRGAINTSRSNIKTPNSVNLPTSIKSSGSTMHVTVYPNPTQGDLHIILDKVSAAKTTVELYNALGAKLISSVVSEGLKDKTIDVSNISNGVYFLKIIKDGSQIVEHVVISK